MRERAGQILRITCLVLGALLVMQLVRLVAQVNPLGHLRIPALPALSVLAEASPASKGTNTVFAVDPLKKSTNLLSRGLAVSNSPVTQPADIRSTNSVAEKQLPNRATNGLAGQRSRKSGTVQALETKARIPDTNALNRQQEVPTGTNSAQGSDVKPAAPGAAANAGSNAIARVERGTTESNSLARVEPGKAATNTGPAFETGSKGMGPGLPPGTMAMGMNPSLRPGMGKKPPDLPPAVLARVDRVTDSEILGPVMRPLPMALLGIAGDFAFLRSQTGQSGMIKEGEDLGPIKLLRIGTNRVLIELEGQKKELMIFSGLGGESLLPKDNP